jgi:hypothetical protein
MELTPEFCIRILMVASSPGENSLTPLTLAESEGLPPKYMFAAETGRAIAMLQTTRAMTAMAAFPILEKQVEVMLPLYWSFFLR